MNNDISILSFFADLAYSNDSEVTINNNLIANPNPNISKYNVIALNRGINGFQAIAVGKDTNGDGKFDEVVIAYRGSDSALDWGLDDLQIALGLVPSQKTGAVNFYNSIINSDLVSASANITLTGHSLGGALTQLVAAETGAYAVTFNAPGMAEQASTSVGNIINYVNLNDFIGCYGEHVGEVRYYLPDGMINGSFVPHSDYLNQDFSNYITLPSSVTWTYKEALALWGYDVNNNHDFQKILTSFNVTKSNLDKAVLIIEQYLGDKQLLETSFKFQIPNNYCYCIGSKYDDYLEGSNKNDKLWGNDGDDTLKGLDGNDTLYGVTGDDYLEGGKGNDDIRGNQGYDTYIFYTGDGNDVIKESKQIRPSVVTGVNFAQRRGEIHINNQVITGGTWDETTQTYIGYQEGVTYQWSGINNTQMVIKYGNGDTITIANFDNGDLNLLFDREIITDQSKIPEYLTRDKQIFADMKNRDFVNEQTLPQLKYKDSNGKIYNVINCENTEKLIDAFGENMGNALIDFDKNYILIEEGAKLLLNHTAVDYSSLVSDMKDIINGKEVKKTDLPIQGSDIYIPTSSSQGSPTLQNVYYQYASKPSSTGLLLSGILTVLQIAANIIAQQYVAAIFLALNTGIAGEKVSSSVFKITESLLDTTGISDKINNKIGAIGVAIGEMFIGSPTGAAANTTSTFMLSATKGSSNFVTENINTINNVLSLSNLIVNKIDWSRNDGYSEFYNINPNTGSISAPYEINVSKLDEPDFSTPNDNEMFKLNVSDRGCPLVLDLDGDGIETLDIDNSNIYFNTQNTDFLTKTGWISGDDGLLAIDKNGDGKITQQSELFGTEQTSGFDILQNYDTNNDGIIDANDAQFSSLKLWQDINENGITDEGELKTLTEAGISSIKLNPSELNIEQNKNTITGVSSFTKDDGTMGLIYNVNLAFNKIYTQYNGTYELSVDVIDMPWLRGYGQVEDLQLKMANDESFKEFVKELVNMDDAKQIYDKMDEFLAKWIGCENIDANTETNGINQRELTILNKYLNLGIEGNVTADKKVFFDSSYLSLKNKIYTNFIAQTKLGDAFEINYDYKTDSILFNDNTYSKLITNLPNQKNFYASYIIAGVLNDVDALDGNKLAYTITEKGYGASLISYLNSGFQILDNGNIELINPNTPMYVIGTSGNDVITGTDNADIIYGMDGDDILNGNAGDDYLSGGAGNDLLIGGDGNDTMDGGSGDDTMQGGYGNDVYIYDGQGKDEVIDERWVKIARQEWYLSGWWIFKTWKSRWVYQDQLVDAGNDTIIFGDNINEKDIAISRNSNDLIIELKGTDNKLTIKNWYSTAEQRVENFVFADGFVINAEQIMHTITDTEGSDVIQGTSDTNFIISSSGNDTITAGKGDDAIVNYEGDTTYRFNLGDGHDVIMDYAGFNRIIFGESIEVEDVEFYRNKNDLIMSIKNMSDSITILNWFSEKECPIAGVVFESSDSSMSSGFINECITKYVATGYDDVIIDYNRNTVVDGLAGNDYIQTWDGNDTIIGGLGKDIMKGDKGDDVYYVDNLGDKVVEKENEGHDIINTAVSYELPDNVEELVLIGSGNINGKGNNLDNIITGNDGNNIIDGVSGNNTLKGGKGDDAYIINSTNANDTIIENANEGTDTVQSSITYTLTSNVENLVLTGDNSINGTGNELNNYIIGNKQDNMLSGNAGNDTLYGGGGIDTLKGGTGDDTYIVNTEQVTIIENSNEGNDTVISNIDYTLGNNLENLILAGTDNLTGIGNSSSNTISGNNLDNTFIGGKGNDTLKGGTGSDTYIFNLGDGQDIIEENSPNSTAIDKITFGSGINKNNITFTRQGYDLIITVNNTNDKITIKNSNLAFGSRIERFEFADGTFIDGNELYTLYSSDNINNLYSDVSSININSKASSIDREYHENGNLKSETYYSENALISQIRTYDENGILARVLDYNALEQVTQDITYYPNGNFEKKILYTYNSKNQLTTIEEYGTISRLKKITHSYSTAGVLTKSYVYNGTSTSIGNTITYNYDASGRLLKQTTFSGNSTKTADLVDRLTYTYDNNGNVSRELYEVGYNKATPTTTELKYVWSTRTEKDTVYTYDTSGKILSEITYGGYSKQTSKQIGTITYTYPVWSTHKTNEITYTYDSTGKIIRKLTEVGYDKNTPKTTGMEYVWSYRTEEDIKYTYDSNGKILKEITIGAYSENTSTKINGVTYTYPTWKTHEIQSVNYTYNEYGNIAKIETIVNYQKLVNSKLEWTSRVDKKINYTYNTYQQPTLVEEYGCYYDATVSPATYKTRVLKKVYYQYNDDYRITNEKVYQYKYVSGNWTSYLAEQKIYSYNSDGLVENVDIYNEGTKVKSHKYEYTYDSDGYLIKQTILESKRENGSMSKYNKYQEIDINSYYNKLVGGNNRDTLNGSNQNDNLIGGAGNDILYGNAGNDTLDGGVGSDLMIGGKGNDTYIIDNLNDIIIEHANEGTDTIKVGFSYTLGENLENLALTGTANINGDGNSYSNILEGNSGNNILHGYNGNDILFGGAGNDILYGDAQNDTLIGGTGNDTLYGGIGDDTYLFSQGDGIDSINDETGKQDAILLDSTVSKDNIAIYSQNGNMIIDYGENIGVDRVVALNHFSDANKKIERIELSDGSYITDSDINLLIQNMTAYANNNAIEFTGIESVKNNADLMNLVASAWHS